MANLLSYYNVVSFSQPWTPAAISTALWLDASDASTITESGGLISQWNDKSGNGLHCSQATGSSQPTYTIAGLNGLNTIYFDDTSNYLVSSGNLDLTSGFGFYYVGRNRSRKNYNGIFRIHNAITTASSNLEIYWQQGTSNSGNLVYASNRGGSARFLSEDNAPPAVNTYSFWGVEVYTSITGKLFHAGTDLNATLSGSGTFFPAVANPYYVGIGYGDLSNPDLNGDIGEIIVLNAAPDTATRQKIEGYLAHKWGLTANLDAGHPYKTVAPTTGFVSLNSPEPNNQPLTALSWVDTTGTTIDCSTGNVFKLRANGTSGTISLSNLLPSGIRYALELHLDWASGSITWPIEWSKGDALPTATGGYVITAVTLDGGSSFKIAVMDEALGIVTDGLVLHLDAGNYASYPGSGTTWTDLAGSNNGTLTNGPTFDSANGGSIVFDGSDDVVSSSNCQSIFPGASGSICLWIKTSKVSRQTIVSGFLSADNNRWDLECDNNKGVMIFHGKNTLTGSTNINTGNWINICSTNDGSTTTLYVNGSSDGSLAIAGASFRSNIAFSLGNRTNGSLFPFLGNIAYALTYNRALSATEIAQNFNATRERFGV